MTRLFLDLETYSEVPISHGTHRYAERAEVLLVAWALDDDPVSVWDRTTGDLMPDGLWCALAATPQIEVWAHNSHFDRTVMDHQMGAVCPRAELWRDTMVQALAHSLPGSLGDLCDVLGLPTDKAKDKDGRALVQLFCKPRPASMKLRRATRETYPAEWARFVEYARLDVEAMREVQRRLPAWNYPGRRCGDAGAAELALWHLDQRINDRGVAVDGELVRGALAAVAQEKRNLSARTVEMTDGAVTSMTQRNATLNYLAEAHGMLLDDLRASTLKRLLADDLDPGLCELLQVRLQASMASTSKYAALERATSADGRLRGTLQFCGASRTGRWAGRIFQPQNIARGSVHGAELDAGIDALRAGCADLVAPDVMALASSAVRGALVAPPGRKLVVADLSNIEGRVLAWVAGEEWKLQAFRDFDAGTGSDLYKLAYARSFGVEPGAVTKDQRQVGKVQELALGYEGGVGAFVTFAAAYGIDLDELAAKVLPVAPDWALAEARSFLGWCEKERKPTFGLSTDAFVACDAVKRAWRQSHPAVTSLWADLRGAAIRATEWPETTVRAGMLKARRDGQWLRVGLPSGRVLCYPRPDVAGGVLSYAGMNQLSLKWGRLQTYGGKLVENAVQAIARDVMAHAMPLIEAAGYQIVLTVHDEVICEAPDDPAFNPEHLASLLASTPPWAHGLPLAAAGFETTRYRKD